MIIGICGKSGSGKSTLSNEIVKHNECAKYLEIDKVGHRALEIEEVQKELIRCFGTSIINGNKLDRKKLGEIVFTSRNEMDKLSDITWKYMMQEIDKFIEDNKENVIILDWLLLPMSKYFNMCDLKILMDIPYKVRKMRAMLRDNITEEQFDLREQASINYDENDFDLVIKDNEIEKIRKLVKEI